MKPHFPAGIVPRVELRGLLAGLPRQAGREIVTQEGGAFRRRPFAELGRDVEAAIARLRGWGVRAGMRVGLIAENGYAWLVHDLALIELRCVSVALPETDESPADASLMDRHELNLLLVSARFAPDDLAARPELACIDADNPQGRAARPASPVRFVPRDDDHSFVLGSGTSGNRKGMIVSRRGVEAILEDFITCFGAAPDDGILVFMPLWSLQQRLFYYGALAFGMDLIVVEPANVFAAVRDLKPSILVAPPMLYETIHDQGLTRLFGPRTRLLVSGMAKSRPATLAHFKAAGLPLFEVYALTETGLVAANTPEAQRLGSVGRPVHATAVRIAEDGEILVRKPHFQVRGYFRDASGAARDWENDTWWPTGDVGALDADGFLHVEGRKDATITLPSGQKLQPEAIEGELSASPLLRRAVILHDPRHPFLVAVFDSDRRAEPELASELAALVAEANARLPAWARIERFHIAPEAFSVENGLLTPNFKLNRSRIAASFAMAEGLGLDGLAAAESDKE